MDTGISKSALGQPSTADRALFAVAGVANCLVALGFVPGVGIVWRMVGMSPPEQTLFLHFFVLFVALFGFAYFWIAVNLSNKRGLILISAIGKTSAFLIVFGHYLSGSVPLGLVAFISGDLVFAALFLRFLYRPRIEGHLSAMEQVVH